MNRIWKVFVTSLISVHGLALGAGIVVGIRSIVREPSGVGEDWSLVVTFFAIAAVILSVILLTPLALLLRFVRRNGLNQQSGSIVLVFSVVYLALPLLGMVWQGFAYLCLLPALVALPTAISTLINITQKNGENI